MTTVLAFDPGKTTGFAEIRIHETLRGFDLVNVREISWDDRLTDLQAILHGKWSQDSQTRDYESPPQVVLEAFRLFPHKAAQQIGSDFPSSQVIGSIEAMCFLFGIPETNIVYQVPADIAKVAVLGDHVNACAGSPHKVDAYKHARLYFLRHYYFGS